MNGEKKAFPWRERPLPSTIPCVQEWSQPSFSRRHNFFFSKCTHFCFMLLWEKMLWCFGNSCIFLGWKYDKLEFPFCERCTLFQLRPLGDRCSVALKRNFRGLRKGSPVQNMTNSLNKNVYLCLSFFLEIRSILLSEKICFIRMN